MWAPLTASWGFENRTCAIRVIGAGDAKATRVEYRQTAADINPYIAMATCLAAGLHGIAHELTPPPPASGDASVAGKVHKALPRTLAEATKLLDESTIAREILGSPFRRSLRAHAALGDPPVRTRGDGLGACAAISKRYDDVSASFGLFSKPCDTRTNDRSSA